jgi:type IV pilus assembly protein PilC
MPVYQYKGRNLSGALISDKAEAENVQALATKLRGQQIILISAEEEKKKTSISIPFIKKKTKVSSKDLVIFSRQFATMISSGLPVVQSLNAIIDQITNKKFAQILRNIKDDINQGASLSESISKYPEVFPPLYVNMIKAGEAAGILDSILHRLAMYLENAEALKRKIKSAMIYPMIVLCVAVIVVFFMLVFVLPTFKTIFSSFGRELPLPTKILLGLSDMLRKSIVFIIVGIIAIIVAFLRITKKGKGKRIWNDIQLKLPVFGILLKKVAIAKFSRTLGTLLKSGVPIIQSLDIVAKTVGNVIIEEALLKVRNSIKEGESIVGPLKSCGIFPSMVIQMISVGEETGALDDMLGKIAEFYDDEVDAAIVGLTSMIEPLLIVFMGLVIGAILIAMFMPMFEMGLVAG